MSETVEAVRVRVLPDGRMDRANAAAYLGYAPKTLAIWLGQGKGPKFRTINEKTPLVGTAALHIHNTVYRSGGRWIRRILIA
jgi:hypothetical protein